MSVLLSIYPIVQAVLLRVSLVVLLLFNISSNSSSSNSIVVVDAYCPVVICPGFGNDSIDYDTPLEQSAEVGLQSVLARRGFAATQIYTVPVKRQDWLRVATGLLDIPDFYVGRAKPTGLGYGWYVKRLKETVDLAYTESGGEKVLVIGHSAGGWLARAAMADGIWSESESESETAAEDENNNDEADKSSTVVVRTSERIRCLATIGSIHAVPDQESTCVTRGALKYTDENYPGAYLKKEGIGYVSIGGAAIVGENEKKKKKDNTNGNNDTNNTVDPENENEKKVPEEDEQQQLLLLSTTSSSEVIDDFYAKRGEGSANRVAYTSYKAVSGNGNLLGDGVVPLQWTQLAGAKQLTLDNVLHSINEAGTTFPTDRWYGSEEVIDRWLPTVLKECGNLVIPDDNDNENNNNNSTILEGLKQGIAAILFQEKEILLPLYISLCVGYFIYRYT